jgi:hypothetical protein
VRNGVIYLAFGIGVLSDASFVSGQPTRSLLVAQITGAVPSAGTLTSQPPAPVAVPPSGVLSTDEGRSSATHPFTIAQSWSLLKSPDEFQSPAMSYIGASLSGARRMRGP